jgi:hypothetical protein
LATYIGYDTVSVRNGHDWNVHLKGLDPGRRMPVKTATRTKVIVVGTEIYSSWSPWLIASAFVQAAPQIRRALNGSIHEEPQTRAISFDTGDA